MRSRRARAVYRRPPAGQDEPPLEAGSVAPLAEARSSPGASLCGKSEDSIGVLRSVRRRLSFDRCKMRPCADQSVRSLSS